MTHEPFVMDESRYVNYYVSQAGGELPGYSGSRVQYGAGIGGLLRGLLRWAYPLVSRGVAIVKPHIKRAASDVTTAVLKAAVERGQSMLRKNQDGNGLVVFTKKAVKRPPARRVPKPATKKRKRKSTTRRAAYPTQTRQRRTTLRRDDIF
ncbi:hypothetical protein WMY93_018709 [Mugilogobius chulae]|uniref:Uncharacterized protein n=1 Tax=Mugilogobius chulae TaxID=88201 RepID=A0AAW0NJM8_9GOBI